MTREFAGIFSRPPDEIVCGDYIYHSPAFERQTAEIIKSTGALYEKYRSRRDESRKRTRERFTFLWKERSFDCKKTSLFYEPWLEGIYGENGDPRISALIEKLAAEGGPFMDIASSESMGLAPYFLKMNPGMPCLITDIDSVVITDLRSYIDEYLPEYKICLAAFDNYDIPIKDASLPLVTGRYGISSSCGDIADADPYRYSANKEKVINEIYRILEPGGMFITTEMGRECDFDLRTIYERCEENGPMFGAYTFDEMKSVLELLKDESWRDIFASAGFEIAAEKKYCKKYTRERVLAFLRGFVKQHGDTERLREQDRNGSPPRGLSDGTDEEDSGFDIYYAESFFILRKPST